MAQTTGNLSDENPLQGYFEWQVTTLMLAYDLSDPIPPSQPKRGEQRRERVESELGEMVMNLLPEEYKADPERDWPPELMMSITRATLQRAAALAGLQTGGDDGT